jgi:NAD(P)H dehydrogenase (quinone)
MTFIITGAAGHYGRLVVEAPTGARRSADQIVAAARNVGKTSDLANRGVGGSPHRLRRRGVAAEAVRRADKVLLVSGTIAGVRVAQHRNAIDSAVAAGRLAVGRQGSPVSGVIMMRHRSTAAAQLGVAHGTFMQCA